MDLLYTEIMLFFYIMYSFTAYITRIFVISVLLSDFDMEPLTPTI